MHNMPEYSITNSDFLFRRFSILEEPNYAVFWKLENGKKIPSSAAFKTKPNENGLSVDIATLTTPETTVGNSNEFGVAEISAETPINLGYVCIHDPMPIAKKLSKAITRVFDFSDE